MKRRIIVLGLAFLLLIALLTACNSNKEVKEVEKIDEKVENQIMEDEYGIIVEGDSVVFTDSRGENSISKNPEKTVILFASYVDIWMNNGGQLVGMVEPSEEYEAAGVDSVELVGKVNAISLEKVISLDPDLLILSSNISQQLDMIPSLESAGIEVIALDYTFKEDYFKTAKLFATINDKLELYESGAKKVAEEIEEILEKVENQDKPTAAIIMSNKSNTRLRMANTSLGEMFKDLGVINIGDKENNLEGMIDFSLEKILEEDPDFIFMQLMGSDVEIVKERIEEDIESNPAWSSLSAVKNNNYIILPKDLYTYKANDRYGEAYRKLAEILYPEVFN